MTIRPRSDSDRRFPRRPVRLPPTPSLTAIDGREVVRFDMSPSLGEAGDGARGLAEAARRALIAGRPLVAVLSGDVTLDVLAPDLLSGLGDAALSLVSASGRVPLLAVLDGQLSGAPSLLAGLFDHVVMTERGLLHMHSPGAVRHTTGVRTTSHALGGLDTHLKVTAVAGSAAPHLEAAIDEVSRILGHLPDSVDGAPPCIATLDPSDRSDPILGDILPPSPASAYDVRDVVRALVDDRELLELRAAWASNLVTGFASVAGVSVGVVANQPAIKAGTLDVEASQKGARFVAFCDAFGIPVVTLVDTPGFFPGKDQEWRGMIRHGAELAFAYARATTPRISLTLRKSYGGAYIVMDSKRLGCDIALAWPSAEIAVMGAKGAAQILHRRATPAERERHEAEYEARLLNPWRAAERGLVDAVIDPADTRRELAACLSMLSTAREHLAPRAHDNSPL